ncbi:MAG: hypothetical protein Q9168_002331 [Polycauliona sp. 1 TL-2023]
MSSTGQTPLGEVLDEVETVLGIRHKLQDRAARDYPFTPDWMDKFLGQKVRQLSQAQETLTTLQRLQCINRMLDCQFDLIEQGLTGLADQLTLAIVSQKSELEDQQSSATATADGPVCAESPSGDRPEGWKLQACATGDSRVRGGDLRLLWVNGTKTLKVLKGRKNKGNTILDLEIFPDDLEQFFCSKKGSKVLLEQCFEDESKTTVYLRMENSGDVASLYAFLLEASGNVDFERQVLTRYVWTKTSLSSGADMA